MDQRTPNYKLILGILVVVCAATYWARLKPVRVLFTADLDALPKAIGSWTGADMPVEQPIREILNADKILSRSYVNTDEDSGLSLWIVYRKFGRRDFAHRPEMCYPASGWEITGKGRTTVPYGGRDIQAVKVVAEKGLDSEVIVYWFASGERTEASFAKQQLWMALDRLRTQKYGWAFIRVSCLITDTEENALKRIRGFLSAASIPLAKVLREPDSMSARAD